MNSSNGAQRLTLPQLHAWETLGYGMFLSFGLATFEGVEVSPGDSPSTLYAPDQLDVDQWVSVARDAGMKYAVLTTKHTSGHCLWPSQHTDYHVGTSGNQTDVVAAFVNACERRQVLPGLYYNSWDSHHRFGSLTPGMVGYDNACTTRAYQDFQMAQVGEILTRYGPIGEVWIDIPRLLPRDFRQTLYNRIAELQPATVIIMNHGLPDPNAFSIARTWPTDVLTIERGLPTSYEARQPWREIEGRQYYIPAEVCDTLGRDWFFVEGDQPRRDAELAGMYLLATSRGANLLLDVPPDKHGRIPPTSVAVLMRLRKMLDTLGGG